MIALKKPGTAADRYGWIDLASRELEAPVKTGRLPDLHRVSSS